MFRVLIVQFMDAYSLDVRALKKSCIHFAQQSAQRKGPRKVIPIGAQ